MTWPSYVFVEDRKNTREGPFEVSKTKSKHLRRAIRAGRCIELVCIMLISVGDVRSEWCASRGFAADR